MLETVLSSAVVAAIVAGSVSVIGAERRIAMENVTQERAKWRARVRELSDEIWGVNISLDDAPSRLEKLRQFRSRLTLILNPHDQDDEAILDGLRDIRSDAQAHADEFFRRISLLLKHDWERAKYEASLWRQVTEISPRRARFEGFRNSLVFDHRISRWRRRR